jgi:hypothetical protein
MPKVRLLNGKPILVNGKVAMADACCCGGTGTGACCIGNECRIVSEADCIAAGGTFQGSGTTCTPNPCCPTCGACCNGDECYQATEDDCFNVGGTFGGVGSTCSEAFCPCAIIRFDTKLIGEYSEGLCFPPDNCPLEEFDAHFHTITDTMSGDPCSVSGSQDFLATGSCIGCSANASLSLHIAYSITGRATDYDFVLTATQSGGECGAVSFTMTRTGQVGGQTFTDNITHPTCGNTITFIVVVSFL